MTERPSYADIIAIGALSVWIGVAVFIAAVLAPAAFAVLPTRALAGAIVGEVLPVLFIGGIVVGGVVAAVWARRTRAAAIGGFLLLAGSARALTIEHRLHALLVSLGAPIDSIATSDPRRIAFGRMHGLSVLFMGVGLVGACIAVVVLMRRVRADGGSSATSLSYPPAP